MTPFLKSRGAPGRADLLHAMAALGSEGVSMVAPLLGFESRSEKPEFKKKQKHETTKGEDHQAEQEWVDQPTSAGVSPFLPWRIVAFEPEKEDAFPGEPAWFRQTVPHQDSDWLANPNQPIPGKPPLLPWARLWPYLRGAFGYWRPSGEVHVERLVETIVRGDSPREIPCKGRLAWASISHLILDFSSRLRPFHEDFLNLLERLTAIRGRAGLHVWIADDDSLGTMRKLGESKRRKFPMPPAGTPVVVLSDLGQYPERGSGRKAWARFGKRLRAAGCLPLALAPCPRSQWHAGLSRIWYLACWDRAQRLPKRTKKRMARMSVVHRAEGQVHDMRDRLGILLSPAIRIEPGLLRAARVLLPLQDADVGSEYQLWNHPKAMASSTVMCMGQDLRTTYQSQFAEMDLSLAEQLIQLLGDHHDWLSKVIPMEEKATALRLLGRECPEAEAFFKRLSLRVTEEKNSMGAYVMRLANRQTTMGWQASEGFAVAFILHNKHKILEGLVDTPDGLDLRKYLWLLGLDGIPLRRSLIWQGQNLYLNSGNEPEFDTMPTWDVGCHLGNLTAMGDFLQVAMDGEKTGKDQKLSQIRRLSLQGQAAIGIKTTHGQWRLATMALKARPNWAKGFGCDAEGLYAEVALGENPDLVRWLPPGPYSLLDREEEVVGIWPHRQGCWMVEREWLLFSHNFFLQPEWADDVGVDDWGIYAEVSIKGVVQRFRLIFPGSFLMGSPEDEPGRFDDEIQHFVTLTRGYWLADSTCTQALWKGVMKNNPSYFKGQDFPVEQVSWEDCRDFLQSMNQIKDGLRCRLPREAEWEYACRASTNSPYAFGKVISTDQVNYDGDRPNEGSPRGVYRGKTIPVKGLPPNSWGVYQLHGNIWEWCVDWYSDYSANEQLDPEGPVEGAYRVVRGGSWSNYGRYCRSAYRRGREPGIGDDILGFRLARGLLEEKRIQGPTGEGDRHQSGTDEE